MTRQTQAWVCMVLTVVPASPVGRSDHVDGALLSSEGCLTSSKQRALAWKVEGCELHGKVAFLFSSSVLTAITAAVLCAWFLEKQVSKLYWWIGDLTSASSCYDLYLSLKVCDVCLCNIDNSKICRGNFSLSGFQVKLHLWAPLHSDTPREYTSKKEAWEHSIICSVGFVVACHLTLLHWPFKELDKGSMIYSLWHVYMETTVFYHRHIFHSLPITHLQLLNFRQCMHYVVIFSCFYILYIYSVGSFYEIDFFLRRYLTMSFSSVLCDTERAFLLFLEASCLC